MELKDKKPINASEWGNKISELEQELDKAQDAKLVVVEERIKLQKEILILRTKLKDLEDAEEKAAHNMAKIKLSLNGAKAKFWSCKDAGL